jgi:hypothetical protein
VNLLAIIYCGLGVYFITHITVHAAKRVPRHSLLVKFFVVISLGSRDGERELTLSFYQPVGSL